MMMIGLTVGGCASEETDEDIPATRLSVDREPRNDSSTDEFTWDTMPDQAIAMPHIRDFTAGNTSLRVYDGAGGRGVAALNPLDSVKSAGKTCLTSGKRRAAPPAIGESCGDAGIIPETAI